MGYPTLMVHMDLFASNDALLQASADLADLLGAAVVGIAVCQPSQLVYPDTYVSPEIYDQDRHEVEMRMREAEKLFRRNLEGRSRQVDWRSTTKILPAAEFVADESCGVDLILTAPNRAKAALEPPRGAEVSDIVMRAGRPVLIVPENGRAKLDRVVVAWKDTREARRALLDAMLLLGRAKLVSVIEIAPEGHLPPASQRVGDVVRWLERHGVAAEPVVVTSVDGDDPAQLKSVVRDRGADLVVAGAYGHSRLREWMLGGVTRDLLLHPERCTLVSH